MPQWIANLNVGQVVLFVGGVLFVIGVFVKLWKAVRPVWVGVREFLEDWRGEPARPEAGVPERPGVMKRLATNEEQLAAIRHELYPNSGSSLRDRVDSIDSQLREHLAQQQG